MSTANLRGRATEVNPQLLATRKFLRAPNSSWKLSQRLCYGDLGPPAVAPFATQTSDLWQFEAIIRSLLAERSPLPVRAEFLASILDLTSPDRKSRQHLIALLGAKLMRISEEIEFCNEKSRFHRALAINVIVNSIDANDLGRCVAQIAKRKTQETSSLARSCAGKRNATLQNSRPRSWRPWRFNVPADELSRRPPSDCSCSRACRSAS